MGLDIYAGTLTRYYMHDWKSVVQQWAEANGMKFQRFAPNEEEIEEETDPARVREAVENWRDQIVAAVSQPGQEPFTPWPEDCERPYYTDKPDWDAYGALLLAAACYSYGEPLPATVSKGWDFMEHPLIRRLSEDQEKVWSLLRGAVWWIPLPDGFFFEAPLPTGNREVIATTAGLRQELERLNELAWRADEKTILGWSDTEGYPADGTVNDGTVQTGETHTVYDTQSLAKFAFSILYQALLFSETHQVPILLDY